MRASELLESRVYDRNGDEVGQVHDIRMVRDAPVQGVFGAGYRVHGLVVGPAGIGVRLGFERSNMHGPWAFKALFRWMHQNARLVEWPLIASVEPSEIRLTVAQNDLPPVPNR
jgi:sporulation protein YlmC with PRC-barrel domain